MEGLVNLAETAESVLMYVLAVLSFDFTTTRYLLLKYVFNLHLRNAVEVARDASRKEMEKRRPLPFLRNGRMLSPAIVSLLLPHSYKA